jgi:hypothetical protein
MAKHPRLLQTKLPKRLAPLAAALAMCASAHAVHLSTNGTGQVLLFPYYNAQTNNQTLISMVNTTSAGKVLNVRILEAYNSRAVYTFNVFLSPFDTWTGAIYPFARSNSETVGAIASFDESCTVPRIANTETSTEVRQFTRLRYFSDFNPPQMDGGPTSFERTLEGHIEVVELSSIGPGQLFDLINRKSEADCTTVSQAIGFSSPLIATGVSAPTGGVYGSAAILDLQEGSYINYNATALDGFSNVTLMNSLSIDRPLLDFAAPAQADYFVGGKLVRSTWPTTQRVDAVSAVLMADKLYGEWSYEASLDASSEWVVSFPTKSYYTDRSVAGSSPIAPFTQLTFAAACDSATVSLFNRAGKTFPTGIVFDPPLSAIPRRFCNSVNVRSFGTGSQLSRTFRSAFAVRENPAAPRSEQQAGSAVYDFTSEHRMRPSLEGHVNIGLPIIGFQAIQILNQNASTAKNYGGAFDLRKSSKCEAAAGASCAP